MLTFTCIFASGARAAEVAMLAYGKSGSNTPFYRLWNGTDWGSESTANSVGDPPYWLVLAGSPIAERLALAVLDSGSDIEVQLWGGSSWGSVFQATNDTGSSSRREFDIAYERVSGHVLLIYRRSGSTSIRYRTHDGTNWSGESSYSPGGENSPRWLRLIPKPGSDEMICLIDAETERAVVWNGSSFSNQVSINNGSYDGYHAAYETTSGEGLVVYSNSGSSPGYRTLISGTWSSAFGAPSVGATPSWLRLAADPASNAIIMATLDSSLDVNVNVWSGTGWGANLEVETSSASETRRAFDVAYERGGTEALLVYDETSSTLKYRTWNGSSWSAETNGPTNTGSPLQTIQAVTGLAAGHVFVTYCTDTPTLRTVVWNGTSFGTALTLGTSSAPKEYEPFMAARAGIPQGRRVVRWKEVEP